MTALSYMLRDCGNCRWGAGKAMLATPMSPPYMAPLAPDLDMHHLAAELERLTRQS